MCYNLKMFKYTAFILTLAVFSCTFASAVFAHGTGVSYEENKDGYKIDIGHDEFIAAGESTRFDFALYPEDIGSIEGEVFSDVWVTFTQDKKLVFAGGINKPVFGSTGFTYVFPEEGTYTVSARFQNEGDTVVETEFTLEILPPLETEKTQSPLVANSLFGGAGLLFGLLLGMFIPRKKNQS